MDVTFDIEITAVRTAAVGELQDVVRVVEWVLVATGGGQSLRAQRRTLLGLPAPADFLPFQQLTADAVKAWIALNEPRLDIVKSAVARNLELQIASGDSQQKPVPWLVGA